MMPLSSLEQHSSVELTLPLKMTPSDSSSSTASAAPDYQPPKVTSLTFHPPGEGDDAGSSVAESLIHRLTKPPLLYHISVLPKDAPDDGARRTKLEAAYAGFVASLPNTGYVLPNRLAAQRAMFENSWVPWFAQWPLFFCGYTADAHVQRATAVVYLTLSIIAVIWRSSPWLWYVVGGMTADAGLRVVGGDRFAVFSCMAEWVTTFLPGTYSIAAAPRQFAWIWYTALLLVASCTSGYVLSDSQDSRHIVFAALMGVLAGFQALELLGVSLPALLFERVLVPCGLFSDVYVHKAEWIEAEKRLKAAVGKAKQKLGGAAMHSVVVQTEDRSKTLLRYDGLVLAARNTFDPIRNLAVIYAFPLLGTAGMADMFFYAYEFAGVNEYVWRALAVCLGFLYLTFWVAQGVRFYLVPQVMLREMRHPHFRYTYLLFLGIPILTIDFMVTVSEGYAHAIYWLCAPLVILLSLVFIHDWIVQPMTFDAFNASWLIAIIINMVSAFELPIAYPDLAELAWLWLGFGLFIWFLIMILIFVRLIFGPPLPDAQKPTLFLMMSTCALGTAALIFQDPQAVNQFAGPLGTAAEFMFWLTNGLALLCYFLLARAYFCRLPFNMSYWAISFPSAALALVWLFYWKIGNCQVLTPPTQYSSEEQCTNNQDSVTIRGVVILCYVNACVGNTILFANTVLAVLQKRLFVPPPQWSPAVALQLHHMAFRVALYRAGVEIGHLAPKGSDAAAPSAGLVAEPAARWYRHALAPVQLGLTPLCPCRSCREYEAREVSKGELQAERLRELLEHLATFEVALTTYVDNKRDVLYPAVEEWLPQVHLEHTDTSQLQAVRARLHRLIGDLAALAPLLNDGDEQLATRVAACSAQLDELSRQVHFHLDHEEVSLTPLLHKFTDMTAANAIMRAIWDNTPMRRSRLVQPWLLNQLADHPQRMAYIDCYVYATKNAITVLGRWLRDGLDPFLYRQLCVDYPRLDAGEPSQYSKFW